MQLGFGVDIERVDAHPGKTAKPVVKIFSVKIAVWIEEGFVSRIGQDA